MITYLITAHIFYMVEIMCHLISKKKIIVFGSCPNAMKKPVSEHRSWLRKCGYPEDIMSRAFHNA